MIMLIMGISSIMWLKLISPLKNREALAWEHAMYYSSIVKISNKNPDNMQAIGKHRLKIDFAACLILAIIETAIVISTFLSFIIRNHIFIINHLCKITRLAGMVIF